MRHILENFRRSINESRSMADGFSRDITIDDITDLLTVDALPVSLRKACEMIEMLYAGYPDILKVNEILNFMNGQVPDSKSMKSGYMNTARKLAVLCKHYANALMRTLPYFYGEKMLSNLVSGKASIDDVYLDLKSPEGRNEVAGMYDKLVWKLVHQYHNKSKLDDDDLYAAGLEGLNSAINTYGKSDSEALKSVEDSESEDEVAQTAKDFGTDAEDVTKKAMLKAKKMSFKSYAAYMIQFAILNEMTYQSRTVSIPQSEQNRINAAGGNVDSTYSIKSLSSEPNNDHENGRSGENDLKVTQAVTGDSEYVVNDVEDGTLSKLYDKIEKLLKGKVSEKEFRIFAATYGMFEYEEMKGKDIAKAENFAQANVTYFVQKVLKVIKSDKELMSLFSQVYELKFNNNY